MNIYLEIFGYIGTALIILSMLMSSLKRLRIVNMCGSVISMIYSLLSGTMPVAVLNLVLILINGYRLLKDEK